VRQTVSAVVVPLVGGAALARCIAQVAALGMRCVVVAPESMRPSAEDCDEAEFLACQGPIPERRSLGIRAVSSEWVAVIEDTCRLHDSWNRGLDKLDRYTMADAVGGPITLSPDLAPRLMALGCVEYGEFPPPEAGAVPVSSAETRRRLPGLCILYRRDIALEVGGGVGLVETDVQHLILQRGRQMWLEQDLAVTFDSPDARAAYASVRFAHGRIYGGALRRQASFGRRLLSAVGSPMLPFILAWRALDGLPRRYRHRLHAGMHICLFAVSWSVGELLGVIAGKTADLRAWR
jgi:hypothetical protein